MDDHSQSSTPRYKTDRTEESVTVKENGDCILCNEFSCDVNLLSGECCVTDTTEGSYSDKKSENTVKDFKTGNILRLTLKNPTSIQEPDECCSKLEFCVLFAVGFAICYFFVICLSICNPGFCADPDHREFITALDAHGEECLKGDMCNVTENNGSIPAEHLVKGYSQMNSTKTIEPMISTGYDVDDTGIFRSRSSG